MTYLNHLTLNTGHIRHSPRHEVDDQALHLTHRLIAAALDGRADMPIPGYQLTATRFGRALLLTIWGGDDPLATIAIAGRNRDARGMWAALIEQAQRFDPAIRTDMPEAPFAAAMLWPALGFEADAAHWIGDFGRTAAWAWQEMPPHG